MYRPFLGDFMLCIHLEYAVTQRLSEGPLLHQFASRFTPLKSPRSRDSFFEKTVPHSGMKCSGNRHKSLLNGTYAALIPLCPRLCRILKYLVSLHRAAGIFEELQCTASRVAAHIETTGETSCTSALLAIWYDCIPSAMEAALVPMEYLHMGVDSLCFAMNHQ